VASMASETYLDQSTTTEESISERRLWTAELVNAVGDWRNGTSRAKRETQKFFFESAADREMVCAGEGLNAAHFSTAFAEDWPAYRNRESDAILLKLLDPRCGANAS
jgi:hypothetical protein